ncbi:MAG: BMP family protein [Bacillota bacterium]|nr:BMP family protein [Bacillota bacterium]
MFRKNWIYILLVLLLVVGFVGGCAPPSEEPAAPDDSAEPVEPDDDLFSIYAIFSTPAEEPWVSVITAACDQLVEEGRATFDYSDNLGYAGDFERELRQVCSDLQPDLITGDAFGNEEAARRVAQDFPDIAFAFGSGLGPAEPNFSVFDNWIHEPAYLLGVIAAHLTETDRIGVVGGVPVPEVNRITNAFIFGVKDYNPDAIVYVTFINSWFDPAAAKEAALAQIEQGADILYAERFGVIEAAAENGLWVFGQMNDQHELAPDYVLSSSVWNLTPTFEYLMESVQAGFYTAQDLKDFSMMAKGGAYLAPFHNLEDEIPDDLKELISQLEQDILSGVFRVDIAESTPGAVN